MDGFAAFLNRGIPTCIQQDIQNAVKRESYLWERGGDRLVNFIVNLTPHLMQTMLATYQESREEEGHSAVIPSTTANGRPSVGNINPSGPIPAEDQKLPTTSVYTDPPFFAPIPPNGGYDARNTAAQLLLSLSGDSDSSIDVRNLHLFDGDLVKDFWWVDTDNHVYSWVRFVSNPSY